MMRFSVGSWLPYLRSIDALPGAVALSIDDGPTAETTPGVLEALKRADARATFFLSGVRAAQFPELIATIVRDGHDIFAHGWEHVSLAGESSEQIIGAMQRCEDLLSAHRPTPSPYLVRLPFGSGHRMPRIHRVLRRWNRTCQIAHWTLLFADYRLPALCSSPEDAMPLCTRAVADALASVRLSGSILVCHDVPFGAVGEHTALVTLCFIEEVLNALRVRGLQAVPIRPSTQRHTVGRCILI
jgi:peptidoglycan/xylan/chitin deacetylase (PgdA/CDA1 family)